MYLNNEECFSVASEKNKNIFCPKPPDNVRSGPESNHNLQSSPSLYTSPTIATGLCQVDMTSEKRQAVIGSQAMSTYLHSYEVQSSLLEYFACQFTILKPFN